MTSYGIFVVTILFSCISQSRSFLLARQNIISYGNSNTYSRLSPLVFRTSANKITVGPVIPLEMANEVSVSTSATATATSPKVRKGSEPEFVLEGDSVKSTPLQKFIVSSHFLLVAYNLFTSLAQLDMTSPVDIVSVGLAVYMSIVLGDLGTGIFHWSVDNYGSLQTPIVGSVCEAFQGHHKSPWTITFREFENNVYKIASGTIPTLLLVAMAHFDAAPTIFLSLFANWWLLSQEIHKYSHIRSPPALIRFLQDNKIILSRKEHGLHHNSPFEAHYCILTGQCNGFLDKNQVFRKMEKIVYQVTGNKPITWALDEDLEKTALL